MKIIGKSIAGHIVEVTQEEIAALCGKSSTYHEVLTVNETSKKISDLVAGDELATEETQTTVKRILAFEHKRKALGLDVSKMRKALTNFLNVIDGKEETK